MPRSYWAGARLLTAEATATSTGRAGVGTPRARIATRSCEGRPLAAAGVNLKSAIEPCLPAKIAASRGSAEAGVKVEIRSKLNEIAGGRPFWAAARPMAGVITSADAASISAAFPPAVVTLLST